MEANIRNATPPTNRSRKVLNLGFGISAILKIETLTLFFSFSSKWDHMTKKPYILQSSTARPCYY